MPLANDLRRTYRSGSFSSDDGSAAPMQKSEGPLPPPILVYHESARSIVFRDHLRRSASSTTSLASQNNQLRQQSSHNAAAVSPPLTPKGTTAAVETPTVGAVALDSPKSSNSETPGIALPHNRDSFVDMTSEIAHTLRLDNDETVMPSEAGIAPSQIIGFTPRIQPLTPKSLGPNDVYKPLLDSFDVDDLHIGKALPADWTAAERQVVGMLERQQATVKTIKNTDWTAFLHRFTAPLEQHGRWNHMHDDIPPSDDDYCFNSFVTSTTLLPDGGKKMRCFGSPSQYTTGVVFGLPIGFATEEESSDQEETEEEAAERTMTWSWPSGYSAKTEFNVDSRGFLINGRKENLRSLAVLREYNDDYLTKDEYMVSTRLVTGLNTIPYNEVFLRVGGLGRIVEGKCVATGRDVRKDKRPSFDRGVGLPLALFVRTASYGHLISMLRTRSRLFHVLGERHFKGIPLLLITPELGIRVLTESMQRELWKIASQSLNPFQNFTFAHRTTVNHTDEASFQEKVDELLDLDENIRNLLTPEELARLAGGFGATDDSVAMVLKQVMMQDRKLNQQSSDQQSTGEEGKKEKSSHRLQDVVNEGLEASVRSGDYHTSRQLLILYSLVATHGEALEDDESDTENSASSDNNYNRRRTSLCRETGKGADKTESAKASETSLSSTRDTASVIPAPPPPPPLDTDRLRSATNSDGLLAVLGAAEVLKAMQNGNARKRTEECVEAVEEWVNMGEQSIAFRISSWYDQRAAQDDLQIAMQNNSNFMAFVSNKAVSNRKKFGEELRRAVTATDFTDIRFLQTIDEMLSRMHSPCLRLELLQYVLGLDNRYSLAHVRRSVELAATCLGISSSSTVVA